jgi:hypothetical protein
VATDPRQTEEAPRDWVAWHAPYDVPGSRLARRLAVVRAQLLQALDQRTGEVALISMCAGQGRDVLPVLAEHPRRVDVRALLVELDERNADTARETAAQSGLNRVEVRVADAALTENYAGYVPADVILACGIFGNISKEDIKRTVEQLPSLAAPTATVLWTRGRFAPDDRTPDEIREWFAAAGFEEVAYDAPEDSMFSVGMNRLAVEPRPFERGVKMFTFFR